MTRMEYLQSCSKEELVKFLCSINENDPDQCGHCPASELCHIGHTGFADWLEQPCQGEGEEE